MSGSDGNCARPKYPNLVTTFLAWSNTTEQSTGLFTVPHDCWISNDQPLVLFPNVRKSTVDEFILNLYKGRESRRQSCVAGIQGDQ